MLYLNGEYLPEQQATISVFDHGFLYGDGLYETINIYNNIPLLLHKHYERLTTSAQKLHIKWNLSLEKLRNIINHLISENQIPQGRCRITLSRGVNHFDFSNSKDPTLLITITPHTITPKTSFSLITYTGERALSSIKTTNITLSTAARNYAHNKKYDEALLISESGYIREGGFSNFFCINPNTKSIITAPLNHVLPGVMMLQLFEILKPTGYHVDFSNFKISDITDHQYYAYVSSSIIGIKPIHKINQSPFPTEDNPLNKFLDDKIFKMLSTFTD